MIECLVNMLLITNKVLAVFFKSNLTIWPWSNPIMNIDQIKMPEERVYYQDKEC